ncbi:MAG: hypothetical protein GF308_06370 [Candidatus Heimdallarchaeota archaeon]|nr:hypothetical protein [Candidatus Heimdallarchaeota archaeon]
MKKEINYEFNEVFSLKGFGLTVTFTALVFISTSIFYLALTSTGFFNFGEMFIYLAALIGGPIVGGIAGGLGASLADVALGYGIYAPATAVLKFLEGFIVGFLYRLTRILYRSARKKSEKDAAIYIKIVKFVLVGIIASAMIIFASFFVTRTISGGFGIYIIVEKAISFSFPGYVLLIIAIVLSILLVIVSILLKEKGEMALSCIAGGIVLIPIGYFLYQITILQVPVAGAMIEIPFNIAQVIFGTAFAIPIVSYLEDLGIIPSSEEEQKEQVESREDQPLEGQEDQPLEGQEDQPLEGQEDEEMKKETKQEQAT